jgi:hypothetical protein
LPGAAGVARAATATWTAGGSSGGVLLLGLAVRRRRPLK